MNYYNNYSKYRIVRNKTRFMWNGENISEWNISN